MGSLESSLQEKNKRMTEQLMEAMNAFWLMKTKLLQFSTLILLRTNEFPDVIVMRDWTMQ